MVETKGSVPISLLTLLCELSSIHGLSESHQPHLAGQIEGDRVQHTKSKNYRVEVHFVLSQNLPSCAFHSLINMRREVSSSHDKVSVDWHPFSVPPPLQYLPVSCKVKPQTLGKTSKAPLELVPSGPTLQLHLSPLPGLS